MKRKEDFDYEAPKKKTLEEFRSGKSLFDERGTFSHIRAGISSSIHRTIKKLRWGRFGSVAKCVGYICAILLKS